MGRQRLNLLNTQECEKIHKSVLEVLETVGVAVKHPEAIELLRKAGARIDGDRVFISEKLLNNALDSVPGPFTLHNRLGEPVLPLEKGRSFFGSGSETQFTYDIQTGERRESAMADIANAAKLADALDNIDFVMALGMASDAPLDRYSEYQFKTMMENTVKPLIYISASKENTANILDMARAVAGGRKEIEEKPFMLLFAQPTTPLQHNHDALDNLLLCAERKAPLLYVAAGMLGGTVPVTMAGAIVVVLAETLSGLVIHQLKNPGAPFVSGSAAPQMDMRTFLCSYGAPELQISCEAMVDMTGYYNLPVFVTAGCSDSHVCDTQTGMEAGYSILTQALAGANLIHDLGYIGGGMTSSLEMLCMSNDMAGIARHMVRGMEVNPETIAMDVIRTVGPGGNFLTEEHTLENYRENLNITDLQNRYDHTAWCTHGSKDFYTRANEFIRETLATHEVIGIRKDAVKEINNILSR